ncbi:hypothetical protein DB30_07457 [Enhygromyxa salina]|uniref:BON domain-containing protein n=2 Tax=Enhygromyxa salina TaxID=215803 RepID=A0A0C1Z8E7_9BACT|nr:hypothetical protein DB30_07457 [Enhygromyxa salina]
MGRGGGRQHDDDRWSRRHQPYDPDEPRGARGHQEWGREPRGGSDRWGQGQWSDDRYDRYGDRQSERESRWSRPRGDSGDRERGGNSEYGNYGGEYAGRGFGIRSHDQEREFRPGARFEERIQGMDYDGGDRSGSRSQGWRGASGMGGAGMQGGSDTGLGSGYRDLGGSFESPEQRRWDHTHSSRSFRGKGPKGYKRSDDTICDEVCQRLEEGEVDPSEVTVKVEDGNVTLTGTTETRWDKRTIEDIAFSVRGVKDVHNQIRVESGQSMQQSGGGSDKQASDRDETSNWRTSSAAGKSS